MMKHKVGDRVRIRKDLDVGKFYGRCFFRPEMKDLCGKTTRIAKVFKDEGCYCIDSSTKYWTDEMFEDDVDTEVPKMNKCVIIDVYGADRWDKSYMERGIVFKTKEEAVECAKKMLAAVKREG